MTSKHYNRPVGSYAGEAGLPNTTKFQDDSAASPRRPISSAEFDGEFNYILDALNELFDVGISASLPDGAVTDPKFRDSAALSVIGRSANSTGSPADIVASSTGDVLRRSGTTLAFGKTTQDSYGSDTIDTPAYKDSSITAAKLNSSAVTEAKIATGAVTEAKIADSAVTTNKVANSAITLAKLSATGTASSATFLRGDNTWANPAPFYESGQQTITSNGSLTLTHGLGYRPKRLSAYIVCVTTERGYPVGAWVMVSPVGTSDSTDNGYGVTLYTDNTTEVKVKYGVRSSVFLATDLSSGTTGALTNANWRLVVIAE